MDPRTWVSDGVIGGGLRIVQGVYRGIDIPRKLVDGLILDPINYGNEHGWGWGAARVIYNLSGFVPVLGRVVHGVGDYNEAVASGADHDWAVRQAILRNVVFLSAITLIVEGVTGQSLGDAEHHRGLATTVDPTSDGAGLTVDQRAERITNGVLDFVGSFIGLKLGFRWGRARPPRGGAPAAFDPFVGTGSPSGSGRLIGWGSGAQQASARTASITLQEIQQVGITRPVAEYWLNFYRNAVANGRGGATAAERVKLMQRVLELLGG